MTPFVNSLDTSYCPHIWLALTQETTVTLLTATDLMASERGQDISLKDPSCPSVVLPTLEPFLTELGKILGRDSTQL